jgi:hypothetical protein
VSAPDPLRAIAALRRCMAAKDYAGAARLVTEQATLDGLAAIEAYVAAERAEADEARREAAAARLAEAERARVQASVGPLLDEVIGVLADAMGVPQGFVCIRCRSSLRRCRTCPYCGARDARSVLAPARANRIEAA